MASNFSSIYVSIYLGSKSTWLACVLASLERNKAHRLALLIVHGWKLNWVWPKVLPQTRSEITMVIWQFDGAARPAILVMMAKGALCIPCLKFRSSIGLVSRLYPSHAFVIMTTNSLEQPLLLKRNTNGLFSTCKIIQEFNNWFCTESILSWK